MDRLLEERSGLIVLRVSVAPRVLSFFLPKHLLLLVRFEGVGSFGLIHCCFFVSFLPAWLVARRSSWLLRCLPYICRHDLAACSDAHRPPTWCTVAVYAGQTIKARTPTSTPHPVWMLGPCFFRHADGRR